MNPFATEASGSMASSDSMAGGMSSEVPMQPMAFNQPPNNMPVFQKKVCFFHVAFKAAALVVFLLSGILSLGYIFTFVLVTIFSALDFWTVKNVSGRLLVGLRWSNTIDENGKSQWHFQSFEDQRFVHPTDSNVFWLGLFVPPVIWTIIAFGMVSRLSLVLSLSLSPVCCLLLLHCLPTPSTRC